MAVATEARPGDVGLKREMGFIGATWSSETSIIGSGWLFGAYFASTYIGPSAIWAWCIAGAMIIVLALVHAELGGMYPVAGGTARFPHIAFGGVAGTSFGFFSWLQAVTVAPVECFAVMTYGQYWLNSHKFYVFDATTGNVTHWGFFFTIILTAFFTAVNFLGMRMFNRINSGITYWKVAVPVLAIIVLLFHMHGGNFSVQGGLNPSHIPASPLIFGYSGWHALFYTIPGASIVFAYLGFEQADQLAGEVKNPQRNLPWAVITSILIGTIIYVLVQVMFIGAMPHNLVTHGFSALVCPAAPAHCSATITNIVGGPIATVAGLSALAWLAGILRLDAFISPVGTGLIYQTSTSRVGYGLGRNRYFPSIFTRVDKNGVPWFSLIMAFVFGLVFLLPFPSWHSLVSLVTSASVLMYAGAPLALGAFRKQLPDAERPYRLPFAAVISPLAFIIASMLIYWSGFVTVWKLGAAIVIGYLLILMYFADNPNAPKLDWKRSWWIFAYLIGMGIISWQGQYGPENTGRIHFGLDFAVVAVFSLAIYFLAIANSLNRHEMEEVMAEQSAAVVDAPSPHVPPVLPDEA
jgi:amino acid transporter